MGMNLPIVLAATIDVATWIGIGTVALGVLGALLKTVWDLSQKRLEAIEGTIGKFVTKDEIETLKKLIEDMDERLQETNRQQDHSSQDLYKTIEAVRESLADARETIAGFGATYVTRKEFYEERNNG
jgi:methyl-accepting chemotaxis protein